MRSRLMDLLPDGVLGDILRRLPPSSLAVSRCVRKSWCTVIDAMRLLRTDLLPLRLDGFFCLDDILDPPPYFFSRNRSTGHRISGRLDFLGTPLELGILDHCNGLLLLDLERVVNPATRQWVSLPPSPSPSVGMEDFFEGHCLVYDPVVSPHYEVVFIHLLPRVLGPIRADSEWPSSPYTTHVFSSRSWRWEERSFVRQGVAAGTIADTLPESQPLKHHHSVYLRGKLYVHCENHTIMRINLSNNSYRVIKCPTVSQMAGVVGVLLLGKSEKGVYSGVPWDDGWPRFRVWLLNDSSEQMEWALKSNISLQALVQNFPFSNHNIHSSWAVTSKSINEHVERAGAQEEFEWDSDDGVLLETKDDDDGTYYRRQITFLGFHPYKEIAFFWVSRRVVSYHLNTSKVQDLGILNSHSVCKSFPYTSCWMGALCENN